MFVGMGQFLIRGARTWRELLRGMWYEDFFRFADDPLRVFAGHVEDGAFVELTASSGLART